MTTLTIALPDIGEGVVEGEVIAWLKQVGDELKQDEPVVVIMTDKATVELPAPRPGILEKQHKAVGELAIKDKPLYDIRLNEGEFIPPPKVEASPAARLLAREEGVELKTVEGTGREGRVTKEDVLKAKLPVTPIPRFEGDTEEPLNGIRQLMAEKMSESCRTIPHFSYFVEADMTRLNQLKAKISEKAASENIQLTYMPFFIRALSLTIDKFPLMNASLDYRRKIILYHKPHNIGIAMAAPYGLIVPVLKNTEAMSLEETIKKYQELKQKAFENHLSNSDMKGGTITLTNFGALPGASMGGTPIINTPESAICGVARVQKRPKVVNDEIKIRDLANISFSFDHRLIDGMLAAQISQHFVTLLENPAQLL